MTPSIPFTRLLWKEYRQVRVFGWLLLVAGLALVLFPAFSPFATARVIAVLFAVAAAATIFSNEHENGTFWFQRALPTTLRDVALAKICVAIIGALAIFLVLWLFGQLTSVATGRRWQDDASRIEEFGEGLMTIVEFLVFGTLMSLVERRPLFALAKAVALVIVVRWLGFLLDLVMYPGLFYVPNNPWTSVAFRGLALAVASFMAFRYIKKWYADTPIQLLSPLIRSKPWQTPTSLFPTESVLRGPWRRLLWLQTRVVIWPFVTLTAIGVGSSLILYRGEDHNIQIITTLLLGTLSFCAAKSHQKALGTFATNSRTVWFSQLTIPSVCCILVVGALITTNPYYHNLLPSDYRTQQYLIILFTAMAAFAWGQLASLVCRTFFGAIGLAILLAIPTLVWSAIVVWGNAPSFWFMLPIFIYPFVESFVRSRRWSSDESRRFHWWAIRFGMYVVLAIGLIFYRAYEIPGVSNRQVAEALDGVPQMSRKQTERFRTISDELAASWPAGNGDAWRNGRIGPSEQIWVINRSTELREILNPDFVLIGLPDTPSSIYQNDLTRHVTISSFLLAAFWNSIQDGDVELGERILLKGPFIGGRHQSLDIVRWCLLPGNSSARIRSLAQRIQSTFSDETIFDELIVGGSYPFQWIEDWPGLQDSVPIGWPPSEGITYFFGEATRWQRRVRYEVVRTKRLTAFILDQIRRGKSVEELMDPESLEPKISRRDRYRIVDMLNYYQVRSRSLRGAILQLALMSWQMDHSGQLPNSLEELKGDYLDHIPIDPLYDKPFGFVKERFTVSIGSPPQLDQLRGADGKLPPFLYTPAAYLDLNLPEAQLVEEIWSNGNPKTWIFPLGLPTEKTEAD